MANTSRIVGFRPVYHLQGARIQSRKYFIPSTDGTAVFPGDVVKMAGSADVPPSGFMDTPGANATVQLAAAGDAVIGVVAGFMPDPLNLNVANQARAASTNRYVWVYDDPFIVFEAEVSNGTLTNVDMQLNANHAVGSPNATTSTSAATIDAGTKATTATLTFKLLTFSSRIDNDDTAASSKVYVLINNHQYKGTGVLGVS